MTLYALRDDSCVLHLPMNEGEGSIVYDYSRYGNNGQIIGANWTTGKFGKALSFDGVDDYVDVGNIAIHNQPSYTITMWVKGPPGQKDKRVFSEGSTSSDTPIFTIGTDVSGTSGKLDIHIRADDETTELYHQKTTSEPFDNAWHFIAWVDNSGDFKIYIDGMLDTEGSYFKSTKSLNRDTIGAVGRSTYSHFFNGLIDEVRIYNRALSKEEIKSLYLYYQNFEVRPCILCPRPTI